MLLSDSPLSDWLAWLETLSPTEINLGLTRVEQVLGTLDLPLAEHVLLIAGTNGKGSSAAMADKLLRAAGKRVGAYTSPHIHRYNERIVVAGEAVDDATIIRAFQKVDAARGGVELTYFEFGTLAAAVVFSEANLDVWILEVGLGGRLDATNAFEPTASLITNVSLDHCDWLGDNIESIAGEKAGVMRSNRPVVYGSYDIPDAISRIAARTDATLLKAGADFDVTIAGDGRWHWRSPTMLLESLLAPGLQGDFQIYNASAVLMLLESVGLGDEIDAALVNSVLPNMTLTGRLQAVHALGRDWILDVAHNPAAAQVLADTLLASASDSNTVAVTGLLDDKDIDGVIGPLLPLVEQWIAITPDSPRALPAKELGRQIANLSGRACMVADSVVEGMDFARQRAAENDKILVTGSFFTVAPAMEFLNLDSRSQT